MTKQEAIENHRKLWNWIADTSEKENRCVSKGEYFESYIMNYCYCCEYTDYMKNGCGNCPIKWSGTGKSDYPCLDITDNESDFSKSEYGLLEKALRSNNVEEFIKMARIIANLPENPDVE